MVRIAQIHLQPTPEQAYALRRTLKEANGASNEISSIAFEKQKFARFSLHHSCYYDIRSKTGLTAQMVVRAIAKVADSYKKDREARHVFKPTGAFAYDDRILRYQRREQTVNLWTVTGRLTIPYVAGARQLEMLKYRKGESDLCMVKGKWYLNAACDIPEEKVEEISDIIGVDLGIKQIATTSEGKFYSGEQIERKRQWYQNRRAALQKVGTKSSKRRLKKLSGKERKFKKDTNHRISKEIVADAKRTHCGIAMENLKGIRKGKGKKVRKKSRAMFSGWSFAELRSFVSYKAQAAGVPVVFVNPRYTSQCCSRCWHIEKANRKSQSEFECRSCGYTAHADFNGAKIIKVLGLSQWSYGSEAELIRLQPQATAFLAVGY